MAGVSCSRLISSARRMQMSRMPVTSASILARRYWVIWWPPIGMPNASRSSA